MPIELTLTRLEATVVQFREVPANMAVRANDWWTLTLIVLAGFFITYVVGAVQDFQRIRDLRAEPSPFSQIIVITKNEAWKRIHSSAVQSHDWVMSARLGLSRPFQP